MVWFYPVFFENWTLVTEGEEESSVVSKTYENLRDRELLQRGVLIALHSRFPVMMAKAGRADDVEQLLPVFLGLSLREPPNGLSLWEGLESMTAEHLGLASYGLQEALLQSCGSRPGVDPVMHVFPACPKAWAARFSLLARGGFRVSSSLVEGLVEYIHVTSNLGNRCCIKNPWPDAAMLHREDGTTEQLDGAYLEVPTAVGESFLLLPSGVRPADIRLQSEPDGPDTGIWELHLELAGKTLRITIGLEA